MKTMRVLIVEDSEADVEWIRRTFAASTSVVIEAERAAALTDALVALRRASFDVVLLDLGLPDSSALHTVLRVRAQFPDLPIVILSGIDDERFALDAVIAGAQDYLVKGPDTRNFLVRALRYAVARSRMVSALRSGLLRDPLTQFYTAAGFSAVVDHYLGTADFHRVRPVMVVMEMNALLNSILQDHTPEIDTLLLEASTIVASSFRPTDVYASLEPGRFAVLVKNEDNLSDAELLARIDSTVRDHNAKPGAKAIEFSIGFAPCSPAGPLSAEDLLDSAAQNVGARQSATAAE